MRRSFVLVLVFVASFAPVMAFPALAVQEGTPDPAGGTPAAGPVVDPLLRMTFPADALPAAAQVWFGDGSWEPGTGLTFLAGTAADGVGFDYVLSGSLAVTSGGPVLVARAGGEPVPAAAGTEVTLGAGEGAAYLDHAADWTGRNPGDAPLELLYLAVESLAGPTSAEEVQVTDPEPGGHALSPSFGEGLGFLDATAWAELAPGPVVATLERVTIAPGASLPPHAGPGQRLVGAPGAIYGQQGRLDEPLTNAGDAPLVVYVVTLEPSGLPMGTPESATPEA